MKSIKTIKMVVICTFLMLQASISMAGQEDRITVLEGQVTSLLSIVATLQQENLDQQSTIATLQNDLARIQKNAVLELGQYVTIDNSAINYLQGPHVILEGVNLHVRNGTDNTSIGNTLHGDRNGLGNLVIGYNELQGAVTTCSSFPGCRSGIHNLIMGQDHVFYGAGGIVNGEGNEISGLNASIITASASIAKGDCSVIGGAKHNARSAGSAIFGGRNNSTKNHYSVVMGGKYNDTDEYYGTAVGGE